jgi:hypothetical protein
MWVIVEMQQGEAACLSVMGPYTSSEKAQVSLQECIWLDEEAGVSDSVYEIVPMEQF